MKNADFDSFLACITGAHLRKPTQRQNLVLIVPGSSLECARTFCCLFPLPQWLEFLRVSQLLFCWSGLASTHQSIRCLQERKKNSNTGNLEIYMQIFKTFFRQSYLVSKHQGDYFQDMQTPLLLTLGWCQELYKVIKATYMYGPEQPVMDASIIIHFLQYRQVREGLKVRKKVK